MDYTIQRLATLAGISTRTLRYYDQIDLLKPARMNSSGYRVYGTEEVNALQQILFYRELGMSLKEIKRTINEPDFKRIRALKEHLTELEKRREQISLLISNVTKTIQQEEGNYKMMDSEKFEGFKRSLIAENEKNYGAEIRETYGESQIEESNKKMRNMTKEEYERFQEVSKEIIALLEAAVKNNETPDKEAGKNIVKLHREFLEFTWDNYSPQAHRGLAQMYVEDERFTQYYDSKVPGCAKFLRDAVQCHVS